MTTKFAKFVLNFYNEYLFISNFFNRKLRLQSIYRKFIYPKGYT